MPAMDVPVDLARQPGQAYRSWGPRPVVDQGGWSSCTWSICQTQRRQHKKASVTFPPSGSNSAGRICGTPGQPQTSPFARPLVQPWFLALCLGVTASVTAKLGPT
jgi:hypothetical protein